MNKKELLLQKKQELEKLQEEYSALSDRIESLEVEINNINAPEVPKDMIGKFIYQENGTMKVMRVDKITTGCESEYASESHINFQGCGFLKNKSGVIRIINNMQITQYPYAQEGEMGYESNKNICEINEKTFNLWLSDAMKTVMEPIKENSNEEIG